MYHKSSMKNSNIHDFSLQMARVTGMKKMTIIMHCVHQAQTVMTLIWMYVMAIKTAQIIRMKAHSVSVSVMTRWMYTIRVRQCCDKMLKND